ncbi:MAG: hypothetical protein HY699_22640 [Deltaproteobacteria bacterium]|nr:hypothetical protein [Deltaproteobacteria bacterium]
MSDWGWRIRRGSCLVGLVLAAVSVRAAAVPLDKAGEMRLGVRSYVNARVGTEATAEGTPRSDAAGYYTAYPGATFPYSAAGHLRQNRYFLEVELKHDLDRLVQDGFGPLQLLRELPFDIAGLNYDLTLRAEADGIYDWGPAEYSTAAAFRKPGLPPLLPKLASADFGAKRKQLRDHNVHRERLFQAYVEGRTGNLFVRLGRQNLSWGETDGFRLLDVINPLDSSFGGFTVSLDERRVPLDMIRAQYHVGSLGRISEMFVEAYAAIDNRVGFTSSSVSGTPWALPGGGTLDALMLTDVIQPARSIDDARGGGRIVFNVLETTVSLAHYYTYADLPSVQVFTNPKGLLTPFDDGLPCANDPSDHSCGMLVHTVLAPQRMQVTGAAASFAIPQWYAVVRSEFAYLKDEPGYTQGQLDPLIFTDRMRTAAPAATGGTSTNDSFNAVVGLDVQQYLRWLNPTHTVFFSTQFFYKHIAGTGDDELFALDRNGFAFPNPNRQVLPVTMDALVAAKAFGLPVEPIFVSQPADSYLQTFFAGTSYRSGTVHPGCGLFYDWGGGLVFQTGIGFSHDPFRFSVDYTFLNAGTLKGGSGVSLLRDRDNVQFRLEYAI